MHIAGQTDAYPTGFLGQFRLYVDYLEILLLESCKCNAVFIVFSLGSLFFTIDKEWSPKFFLFTLIGGVVISTVYATIQVYRRMPRPKLSRTVGLLFFCPVFEILQILGFGLYISACVIQRQFSARSIRTLLSLCLLLPGVTLFSLIVMRSCVQARFLPSSTMEPNLKINDRVLFENVSNMKGTPIERGQIVIFHAPAIAGEEPKRGLAALLGELTGIPVFPNQTTFVKRVIGVANDRIQLRPGDGTYINGKKIDETSYVLEPAAYRLERLSDIKGPSTNGSPIQPYTSNAPIVVPPNMVFVLGDNRNNSIDSHVFGFIDKHLVIGRGWEIFYPTQYYIHPPFWHRPHN